MAGHYGEDRNTGDRRDLISSLIPDPIPEYRIPRYQKVLFLVLIVSSILMGALLFHLHEQAHERMVHGDDAAPTTAPVEVAANQQATLVLANDEDGSLVEQAQSLPLPAEAQARARAILNRLMEMDEAPDAAHLVVGDGREATPNAVAQVFLLPMPVDPAGKVDAAKRGAVDASDAAEGGKRLAVVNLRGGFVDAHPSGIEAETLTILSICATLHANLPQVAEVRFLVNGEERDTLAGHADLSRTYLATEAVTAADTDTGASAK